MIRTTALTTLLTVLACPSWTSAAVSTKDFKARYRSILGSCASGDLDISIRSLVELETAAAEGRTLSFVQSTENGIVRDLAEFDKQVLVPIISLHRQSYFAYQELNLHEMSEHAVAMVSDWASEYVDESESGTGRLSTPEFLTNVTEGVYSDAAWRLLYKALAFDPDHEPALLALAEKYESTGDYKRAAAFLTRLLRIRPDPEAGVLRLAVQLLRLDKRKDAIEILQWLLKSGSQEWIRAIAHQELARIHLADGELNLAKKQLDLGRKEVPSDPSLLISLEYVYEREGTSEGADFFEELEKCAGDCSKSSRAIYAKTASKDAAQKVLAIPEEYFELLRKALFANTSMK